MKNRNKNNYNKSNKTELKIFSNVRGQYQYNRAKRGGISLCIMQYRQDWFSFFLLKVLNNDVRSDDTIRIIITQLSGDNKQCRNQK